MIVSKSESQTKQLAAQIARKIELPAIYCLFGDLGSGKTVFAKGFARAFGIPEKTIKSPTYTFLKQYKVGKKELYHFDLYRIQDIDDLIRRDFEEILQEKSSVILIEWPEKIMEILPAKAKIIRFEYIDDNSRKITLEND